MSLSIENGSVKEISEKVEADAVVKRAGYGVAKGEVKLEEPRFENASYKFVISVGTENADLKELKECYKSIIRLADENGLKRIVVPLLGDPSKYEFEKLWDSAVRGINTYESEIETYLVINNSLLESCENRNNTGNSTLEWGRTSDDRYYPSQGSSSEQPSPNVLCMVTARGYVPDPTYNRVNNPSNPKTKAEAVAKRFEKYTGMYGISTASIVEELAGYVGGSTIYNILERERDGNVDGRTIVAIAIAMGLTRAEFDDVFKANGSCLTGVGEDIIFEDAFANNWNIGQLDCQLYRNYFEPYCVKYSWRDNPGRKKGESETKGELYKKYTENQKKDFGEHDF